jgi:hypothetical protein
MPNEITTDNVEVVQTEEVQGGQPSEGTTVPEEVSKAKSEVQDLDKLIEAKLAERTKSLEEAISAAKKEIQSVKDKARFEVESAKRRADAKDAALKAARQRVAQTSPDVAKDIELEDYKSELAAQKAMEQERETAKNTTSFHDQFVTGIEESLLEMGVDPKDKRLDWASDAENYLVAQKRILKSASKIAKENLEADKKAQEKALEDRLKAETYKLRKELGLDSVDSSAPSGTVSSDEQFLKDFADGKRNSPADVKRAMKLLEL